MRTPSSLRCFADSAGPTIVVPPVTGLINSEPSLLSRCERSTLMPPQYIGVVSSSVASSGIPPGVDKQIAKLGAGSITSASGYLALIFFVYVLGVSLFICAQLAQLHHEVMRLLRAPGGIQARRRIHLFVGLLQLAQAIDHGKQRILIDA